MYGFVIRQFVSQPLAAQKATFATRGVPEQARKDVISLFPTPLVPQLLAVPGLFDRIRASIDEMGFSDDDFCQWYRGQIYLMNANIVSDQMLELG